LSQAGAFPPDRAAHRGFRERPDAGPVGSNINSNAAK
jgi:hypothetical protein